MKLPLPATLPQCVGLYDFEIDETKEKDCLPFKKVIMSSGKAILH